MALTPEMDPETEQSRANADSSSAEKTEAATETTRALTEREKEVMHCILAGKLNKIIADDLQIAMRTVEVHRARIFEKMGVRSAVELAQLLSQGYSPPEPDTK